MNQRRFIFLDIDGVLNTGNHRLRQRERTGESSVKNWCPTACRNINRLSRMFNARIVISSNWKDQYELEELKFQFEENGIPADFIHDLTPSEVDRHEGAEFRALEIRQWLDSNGGRNAVCLIIDDDPIDCPSMEKYLVQVDPEKGFADPEAVRRARDILRNGHSESF